MDGVESSWASAAPGAIAPHASRTAAATGIIVVGQHFSDAMDYLVDVYIQSSQRETLAVTDRAYIINNGRIFRAGSPEALERDPEVKRVYLGETFSLRV